MSRYNSISRVMLQHNNESTYTFAYKYIAVDFFYVEGGGV